MQQRIERGIKESFHSVRNRVIDFERRVFEWEARRLGKEYEPLPRPMLVTGNQPYPLAEKTAELLKLPLEVCSSDFKSGDVNVQLKTSVTGAHVFIVHPMHVVQRHEMIFTGEDGRQLKGYKDLPNPARQKEEFLKLVDAARRDQAKKITAVVPFFPDARMDRKDMPRVAVAGPLNAQIGEFVGVTDYITMDLHSEPLSGAVKVPWNNLYGFLSLAPEVMKYMQNQMKNLVVVSPDTGFGKKAETIADLLGVPLAVLLKKRVGNKVEIKGIATEVDLNGKNLLMVDDLIDTAGTITQASNELAKRYSLGGLYLAAVHPVFSGEAQQVLADSPFKQIWTLDTIPQMNIIPKLAEKYTSVSAADLVATAITRERSGESLQDLMIDNFLSN